jgi:HlyD family secretion protein
VIIRRGGVVNIVASGSGLIVNLDTKIGDMVKSGQVLAQIAQPGLTERIRIAQAALADAKRERERVGHVRNDSAKLQLAALARERSNAEREIATLRAQIELIAEEIPVNEELLSRGLITKQQSLAPKGRIVTLEGQIAAAQAHLTQLDSQTFTVKGQPEESDADMHARVLGLERNVAELQKSFSIAANVVSPYDGKVLEVKVYRGSAVSEGTPIVSVHSAVEALEGLVYLSAFAAKDIKAGMEAQISPGTVRREEYGFLKGRVTFVADYPATQTAIMRVLENESLAQSITTAGPVTEVRLQLQRAITPSGFMWSSGKGPVLEISPGTLCAAKIVTRQERPITVVLPALKDRLPLR